MRIAITYSILLVYLALLSFGCSGITSKNDASGTDYNETGKASFYAMKYQSRKTASGELFDQSANTAAHKTLPFGTKVKVTNLKNDKSVIVRINDRGPFVRGRIIDLSRSAFNSIGNTSAGVIDVKVEVVD
ncbi:MAG: septal ring lytic transglycosylase RlpA family protein [Desulfobulbaceae bacterium]|jgi:rare lipoprotein A|nr:septal ring lytic transglycosylase RlpA family protein [Desulfobulbaceae bacterium]